MVTSCFMSDSSARFHELALGQKISSPVSPAIRFGKAYSGLGLRKPREHSTLTKLAFSSRRPFAVVWCSSEFEAFHSRDLFHDDVPEGCI